MATRIITDSASDILPEECPEGLSIVPLSVTFGGTTFRDGVDLKHRRFYEMLVESDELPVTSQVTPYEFSQAIAEARAAGDEVVVLTMSSKLSGTYESARLAAREAGEGVYVVDSESVTVGERILVELALRLVEEGRPAREIAAELEERKHDVRVVALLDTLEYLRKGGRISAAAGMAGAMLAIKPVIAIVDGEVAILGKARGSKNGKNMLNQNIESSGGIDFRQPLALGYTGLSRDLLDKYIEDSRGLWEESVKSLLAYPVGAAIGTHVGPGAIALAYFCKGRD